MEKEQQTIKAIQEAVPEIMELEFGCRVKNKDFGTDWNRFDHVKMIKIAGILLIYFSGFFAGTGYFLGALILGVIGGWLLGREL